MIDLSIVVPTYNREKELVCLLESVKYESAVVQLIIVDDGSTDETRRLIENCASTSKFQIKYIYQENAGRATALAKGISSADGLFTILMDSDDYFTEGAIDFIVSQTRRLVQDSSLLDVHALLFGIKIKRNGDYILNLPPEMISTYVEVRADAKVKGDLKEVVRSDVLKSCLYSVPNGSRRVPTSLLWARVSRRTRCVCVSEAVAVKEYLPGGMTDRILELKTTNAIPMVELYALLGGDAKYKSRLYRWHSRLLWSRYAWHSGVVRPKNWWQCLVYLPGAFLFLTDRARLNWKS